VLLDKLKPSKHNITFPAAEEFAPSQAEFVTSPPGATSPKARQAGADPHHEAWIKTFREKAEKHLYVFTKSVLGRLYLTQNLHLPLCNFLQNISISDRKMALVPRECGKTSIVSHALPLHIIIQPRATNIYFPNEHGYDQRIIIASKAARLATDSLRIIQSASESNQLLKTLWPERFWEDRKQARSQSKAWSNNELILPRDQANEWPDPTFRAVGVGAAITGSHPSVLIKDDLINEEDHSSPVVMQTAIQWHTVSRALINRPGTLEFVIGCLPGSAQVLQEDGTQKALQDVIPGDRVWAADTDGTLQARTVEAIIPQGRAATLTIETSSKTLRATPNHPFLVRRHRQLHWVRADALGVGDHIISIKEIPGTLTHPWMTEDFCWFFGFLLGDGWAGYKQHRGYVCIAKSLDHNLNARVLACAEEWFGRAMYETPFGYYRVDSLDAAQGLHRLGMVGTAKTKRVPSWAFQLPPEYRRAFLRGFCDADGAFVSHQSWNVEIVNRALLEDLRHLAMLCGVRTGVLRSRTRTIQAPHSPVPVVSTCWGTAMNFASPTRAEIYPISRTLKPHEGLRQERITSITKNAVEEDVYDLTVEGTPSFFANGLAVHNTRWHIHDLYQHILTNEPSVKHMIRSLLEFDEDGEEYCIYPEFVVTYPDGSVRRHGFSDSKVAQLKAEFGSMMFSLQYMNDARDPSLVDFQEADLREYTFEDGLLVADDQERDIAWADMRKKSADSRIPTIAPTQGRPRSARDDNRLRSMRGRPERLAR
jgi:hypothetical protein